MEGMLDKLISEKGNGVALVERVTGREPLGSWPGASIRATFWMHMPKTGGELVKALLMVGVEAARNAALPLRLKLTLNGAGVTREIKPQFIVNLDETRYLKAIYDVKPILRKKHGKGDFHKLQAFYDLVQPVYFRDATLLVITSSDRAKYAISVLTGAKVLEPGEVIVEYPPFYHSFGGQRRASLVIHSPYHEAGFEVVVAGFRAGPFQGSGSFPVEVDFRYDGNLVPVSVKYLEPEYQFYPKRAVITDIILEETLLPPIKIDINIVKTRVYEDNLEIEVELANNSDIPLHRPLISIIALGAQLSTKKMREIKPGSTERIKLRANLRRLSIQPQSIVLSFVAYTLGKRIERSITVPIRS